MKHLVLFITSLVTVNIAFSQSEQDALDGVILQCNQISQTAANLKARNDSIDAMNAEIDRLRQEWRDTCESVLSNPGSTKEDIEYLLDHTYPEIDGEELCNQLKTRLEEVKSGVGTQNGEQSGATDGSGNAGHGSHNGSATPEMEPTGSGRGASVGTGANRGSTGSKSDWKSSGNSQGSTDNNGGNGGIGAIDGDVKKVKDDSNSLNKTINALKKTHNK